MAESTSGFSLNVLIINTHGGFTAFNRRFILLELRGAVRSVGADIVCPQEVMGAHEVHPLHIENWPDATYYEFLADTMQSDYAYGRNTIYPEGCHGNTVLSRFPIEYCEDRDVSVSNDKRHGLLYCHIMPPESGVTVHVIYVHLDLHAGQRQVQLIMLTERVNTPPASEPVMMTGGFNDWRQQTNQPLKVQAGLEEIFTRTRGRPARTLPVSSPLLCLDRTHVKNAHADHPKALTLKQWRYLSDHVPLSVEIHL